MEKSRELALELIRRFQKGEFTDAQIRAFMRKPDRYLTGFVDATETLIGKTNHRNEDSPLLFDGTDVTYISQAAGGDCIRWGNRKMPQFAKMHSQLIWADGKPLAIGEDADGTLHIARGTEIVADVDKSFTIVDGSLGFADGRPFFVRQHLEHERRTGFWGSEDVVNNLSPFEGACFRIVDGKPLAVQCWSDGVRAVYGTQCSTDYASIGDLSVLDGKMLFYAPDNNASHQELVIFGDRAYRGMKTIHKLSYWRDRPLALATRIGDPDTCRDLMWEDQSLAYFDDASDFWVVDDAPFVAYQWKKTPMLWNNTDHPMRLRYRPDEFSDLAFIDGRSWYGVYSPNGEGRTVYVWGMQRTKSFDVVSDPIIRDKEIIFAGLRGRKIYRVSIPRESATT
jgi:hypothetical protein